MTTIQAWQHIYSNVEKEQSPQGRGGFQTLFYSKSALSEAEVEEMEGRLLYFASDIEPVKRVFFSLSSGKRVVAQLVPLSETDQYGRGGRYLAHSLILTVDTFVQLKEDPFPVFQNAPFISTVKAALAQGNFQNGHIDPITLDVTVDDNQATKLAAAWKQSELKKLSMLALRADQMAQERRAVALMGPPDQVAQAVQAAFFGLPTEQRPACTFDTYFYRCNLVATYYWAVGFPEQTGNPTFDRVDVQAREVQYMANDQPQTAYERWLCHLIDQNGLSTISQHRDAAYPLCRWLEGGAQETKLVAGVAQQLVQSVFEPNDLQVRELLRRKLSQHLPDSLVSRVFNQVYDQAKPDVNFQHLRDGFAQDQLLGLLYQAYGQQGFRRPSEDEMKALERMETQAGGHPLCTMLIVWQGNRKALQQHLAQLDDTAYRQAISVALDNDLVAAPDLLIQNHEEAFVDLFIKTGAARHTPLSEVVYKLVDFEQVAPLARLANLIPNQPPKALRRIEKILNRRAGDDVPEAFQTVLNETLAELPEGISIKRIVKTVTNPMKFFGRKKRS